MSSQLNWRERSRPFATQAAANALSSSRRSNRGAQRPVGFRIDQRTGVAEHFGQRAAIRGDDRHAERHRLEHRDPEALVEGRLHQEAGALVPARGGPVLPRSRCVDAAGERRAGDASIEPRLGIGLALPASTSRGTSRRRAIELLRTHRAARRRSCAARACRKTARSRRRAPRARFPGRRAGEQHRNPIAGTPSCRSTSRR